MKTTNSKIIVSGNIIEHYQYEFPLIYSFEQPKITPEKKEYTEDEIILRKIDTRIRSGHRAKNHIHRLANSNIRKWKNENNEFSEPLFITLTFAENIEDVKEANKIFTKFIKRLNFQIFNTKLSKVKYITVTEFQKRGAVHYHCIFFNLSSNLCDFEKSTRRIAEIWNQGFIEIKSGSDVQKVIYYITKYLTKSFDDLRLDGQKKYYCSKGLLKPKIFRFQQYVETLLSLIPDNCLVYKADFENDRNGKTIYKKYLLPDIENTKL